MAIEPSFATTMSKLRSGDTNAEAEIFQRFFHRLIALVGSQFDARHRAKADPEDLVQSAYLSFFRRNIGSPFDITDWEGLWSILATITIRKCIDHRDFWRRHRRDVRREVVPGPEPSLDRWREALDRGPTPLHSLILKEMINNLMKVMEPRQRLIFELILQGYTGTEISRLCDCSERTVARNQQRIRELVLKMGTSEPGP